MRAQTPIGIHFEVSLRVDKIVDRYGETYSRARAHDAPGLWAAFVNDFDADDVVYVNPSDLPAGMR
ncbi:MAG TPA: hypothetical protein VGG39_23505 [Polyangiaceae bacterium]|jgi:hypothetical protein